MQHKRDGLVPIGEVVFGLDVPVTAIRDDSPQAARHSFTAPDQEKWLGGKIKLQSARS